MRAITLYPEHAELFRLRIRTVETRGDEQPWRQGVGATCALHAGKRDPDSAEARRDPISRAAMDAIPHGDPLTRGAVIATFRLADVLPIGQPTRVPPDEHARFVGDVSGRLMILRGIQRGPNPEDFTVERLIDNERHLGNYTPGGWVLVIEDLVELPEPIPARGWMGFWTWNP